VAQPLVGLARLVEEYEEVGAAIGEAASVLNRPLEQSGNAAGLRPKLVGAFSFTDLTFTYLGTKTPALDRVSFEIPAGSMFGVVGKSGSGKSTIARLLQGINRDYSGFLKLDGVDLREINLRHLRQGLGVVLQDNFLFRGSIRDNIIAGRAGLTLSDAVRAAHLAGADEFIERMPNGYDTYIEEGSPKPVRRPAAAIGDRPCAYPRSHHSHPRRGDERARSRKRGDGQSEPDAHRQRAHDDYCLAPPRLAYRV
jgi:ATP-binding cassette subfamily B protein